MGSLAPLAPYIGTYAAIGSGPADAAAFLTALNLVRSYTNVTDGSVPGPGLAPGYDASSLLVITLADITAACINSDGVGGVCAQLFALATPPGGSAPVEVVQAVGYILQNPTNNTAAIFALLPPPPFQPTSPTAPAAWSLPIVPLAATPVISPGSGSYTVAPSITITDSTPGATIYYTTDGSTPSVNSTPYSGAFTLTANGSNNRTVRALAVAVNFGASSVAAVTYMLPAQNTAAALAFLTQPVSGIVNSSLAASVSALSMPTAHRSRSTAAPSRCRSGPIPAAPHSLGTNAGVSSSGGVTFTGLQLNQLGTGYTLVATSNGFAARTSNAFDITPPPIVFNLAGTLIGNNATLAGSFTLPGRGPPAARPWTLTSSDPTIITLSPATVTVPAGATTARSPIRRSAAGP